MPVPFPRIVRIVHSLPGRLRLRLPWLHDRREAAVPLADRLSTLPGIAEVRVNPFSGSVLFLYDEEQLDESRLLAAVREATGVEIVARSGEPLPPEAVAALQLEAKPEISRIERAAATFFHEVNLDVLEASEGRIDLGTLASVMFAATGAAEVALQRKLPLPQWFQLAWWSFRTFTMVHERGNSR